MCKSKEHKNSPKYDNGKTKEHKRKEFMSYFHESKLLHPDQWPENSPVFVTASKRVEDINYELPQSKVTEVPTPFPLDGGVVLFHGPLFRGKIVSRIKDVPAMSLSNQSPPLCSSEQYFKGRSRQFQWTVQGIFSKRCRFDKIVTGQDLERPFRNAPSSTIVKRGLDLMRNRLPETFECDLFADKPRFEHPLICGCQSFRVDKTSQFDEQSYTLLGEGTRGEIIEDCSLLGDEVPKNPEKRRKFFCKQKNLENYYFEPNDYVYTFDFYANFFSPARHRLEINPFFSIDLIPYFNGRPLFMAMAKEKDSGDYLFATEMWHHRLLQFEVKEGILKKLFGSSNRIKDVNQKENRQTKIK